VTPGRPGVTSFPRGGIGDCLRVAACACLVAGVSRYRDPPLLVSADVHPGSDLPSSATVLARVAPGDPYARNVPRSWQKLHRGTRQPPKQPDRASLCDIRVWRRNFCQIRRRSDVGAAAAVGAVAAARMVPNTRPRNIRLAQIGQMGGTVRSPARIGRSGEPSGSGPGPDRPVWLPKTPQANIWHQTEADRSPDLRTTPDLRTFDTDSGPPIYSAFVASEGVRPRRVRLGNRVDTHPATITIPVPAGPPPSGLR
jgi:hypothetical protein